MAQTNLIGLSQLELEEFMVGLGQKPFRGRQAFRWIYGCREYDISCWTDMAKEFRLSLAQKAQCRVDQPIEAQVSEDGTTKYLFRLDDKLPIESVLIPDHDSGRRTLCVSSQVGCALRCKFCATGQMGFKRNLTAGEILSQMMYIRDLLGDDAFTNIVFMGMGEPMHNLEAVMAAVAIITDGAGFSHSAKKITISTAGVIPGINHLAAVRSKVRLAVSLNAALQEKRLSIMPVARKYPLVDLRQALREYTQQTGFRVTFEYALFAGFNDGPEDIKAMIQVVQGIPCKINILAYNPVENTELMRPKTDRVEWFVKQLYPHVPAVTVRKSRGADIQAACGQLAGKTMNSRSS